jgi:hypothetical protein
MKVWLTFGLALALSSVGSAAPLCSSFFGQSVTDINGAGGCTIGTLLFNDFQVINNGGFTSVNINVGAGVTQNGYDSEFAFAINTTPGVASGTGGDILLKYSVTSGGANQIGAAIAIGTANLVTITETICTNPFSPPGPGGGTTCVSPPASVFSMSVNSPTPPGQTTNSLIFTPGPLQTIYVQKDIAFSSGGSISDFVNVHTAVPEPTTSLLMGTALLGLALLRKRFSNN